VSHEAEVEEIRIPGWLLAGAGLLIASVITLALVAKLTNADRGAPRLAPITQAVAARDLIFKTDPRNAAADMQVLDATTGTVVKDFGPTEGGFVRGSLRGLAHLRTTRGISPEEPYRLTEWPGGRLTLQDQRTGMIVEINAFGLSSVEGYRTLLPPPTAPESKE
jgi:putative photosynthetic complex assembly protein